VCKSSLDCCSTFNELEIGKTQLETHLGILLLGILLRLLLGILRILFFFRHPLHLCFLLFSLRIAKASKQLTDIRSDMRLLFLPDPCPQVRDVRGINFPDDFGSLGLKLL